MRYKKTSYSIYFIFICSLCLAACSTSSSDNSKHPKKETIQKVDHTKKNTALQVKTTKNSIQPSTTTQKIDWNAPSGGAYPALAANEKIWIDVSIHDQKVYIKNGNNTIYTMIASSGIDTNPDNSTPKGTFYIQPERGEWFYSAGYKEGAEYWVSWKNHGEFLFHSVPMDKDKNVIKNEAEKLGQKASHGCIRLAIPDAKWIYDNIKTGTKVVIRS